MRHNSPTCPAFGALLGAVIMLGALCAAPLGCSRTDEPRGAVAPEEAGKLLLHRNWLDRWPAGKDDRLHVYRFVPAKGGMYQDRTLYLGFFEVFTFTVGDRAVRFHYPDMDERVRSRFRIERVSGPEPFDIRLTLEPSPRGPAVYYSRKSWHGATWHDLDRQLAELTGQRRDE